MTWKLNLSLVMSLLFAGWHLVTAGGDERQARAAEDVIQSKAPDKHEQPHYTRFWKWLDKSNYRNWAPWPGQNGDFYEGKAPHGAYLKIYVNRTAAGASKELPPGSIIIKENFDKKKNLVAITVMHRIKGYDSEHNDWYWVKYNAKGNVARTPQDKGSKPIAGKFQSCINCHSRADGKDFVFVNDKKQN